MGFEFQRRFSGFSLAIAMFKRILPVFLLCASFVHAAQSPSPSPTATANPPSEASIKQLLEVTQARKLVDSIMSQMDNLMQQAVAQAAAGREIPDSVQKEIDRQRAEMIAMMKQVLDWQKLEPIYVRIYQKTFTQQELDGMLAFYKTPAGAAVITKMPSIMQNTMDEMQGMMGPVMEKVQHLQQDVAARMKDVKKSKGG
jgi:hypothetical protein